MKYLAAVVILFLSEILVAQEKQPAFTPKVNEHSLSFEPASFSYSYAHTFHPHVTLGASLHVGMAILAEINLADTYVPKPIALRFEILKLQLFYRMYLTSNTYINIGGYYSLGFSPYSIYEGDFRYFEPNEYNQGIFAAIFYGHHKIKFGHKIQFGLLTENYQSNEKNTPVLLVTPFILR